MITEKTVLVLGAGASVESGYPTGAGVIEWIRKELSPTTGGTLRDILQHLEATSLIDEFARRLHYAHTKSVDAFLERQENSDVRELGTMAIAACLLHAADAIEAADKAQPRTWYQYLADCLEAEDWFTCSETPLDVITFNYDTSLEEYLIRILYGRYHCDSYKIDKFFEKRSIVHVHGSLGLPKADEIISPDTTSRYSFTDRVRDAHKSIKIISDPALEDSSEFKQARELLKNAKRICFLGFGYHEQNIKRLQLEKVKGAKFFGTTLDEDPIDVKMIRKRFKNTITLAGMKIKPFLKNYRLLEALPPEESHGHVTVLKGRGWKV